MLVENTLFGVNDKVQNSIDALRSFEPPEGYYLAFSGGKDSVVVKRLCDMAGVKYDAHYNVTSVDPPELVQFIKEKYPDVHRDIPHDEDGKPITMWNLIPRKKVIPTRIMRFCCEELKERGGVGRMTLTGVRWAESVRRKKHQGLAVIMDNNTVLNNDNAESRELLESCYKKRKTVINPIINWEDEDVWELIHRENIPYCKLYDEGEKRLGCIGCPIAGSRTMERDFAKYPKYKELYLKAFGTMIAERERAGLSIKGWETPEKVMEWWLSPKADKPIEGQIGMEL